MVWYKGRYTYDHVFTFKSYQSRDSNAIRRRHFVLFAKGEGMVGGPSPGELVRNERRLGTP